MTERIPLLLLPGLLNDAELWRDQLADLADIAEATVGDLTRGDTMQAVADAVLAQAPPRFALAGFSLGGFVAQQILRSAPQRVLRLALIDTSIHADSPQRAAQRAAQIASVRLPGRFHGFGDTLMRSYIDASRLDDQVLVQRVRDMTARLGAEVFLRQSGLDREDGHALLASYRDPLLIVCGENDRITPLPISREMQALAPQATLVVVPGCGHLAPMEKPAEVSAAMREWLLRD
ncbi:pimeloyl-ACP methyl ester carboxylesterase [Stenotrophomonas maltophilia]|uniref:alpha/beta fold hydrolase n=1 Tax=Stenotrophomonas chelatiphaga TaxID=517011 RepID=UPI000F4C079F|nr:alpha/beta hydrolase [Stenotrophomonas chelatiphaga]MCS4230763.1 pimeloyl-ACP methyl ester carboxylesterase [Stenotrophomonas chelatiphaga]ROQ40257.1 pimeloyl-ACP methyl ester carboxylesterase [Stenotrophomonas maltophilia]